MDPRLLPSPQNDFEYTFEPQAFLPCSNSFFHNTSESDDDCITAQGPAGGNNNPGPNHPDFETMGTCPHDAINPGDVIEGNINTFSNVQDVRDTDWFLLNVDGYDALTISLCPEFNAALITVQGACIDPLIVDEAYPLAGETGTITLGECDGILMEGDTTIFISTNLIFMGIECGENTGYTLSIEDLCAPDPIPTLSQWGLIILGLILLIFGMATVKQRGWSLM